jgi:hypothetical protein
VTDATVSVSLKQYAILPAPLKSRVVTFMSVCHVPGPDLSDSTRNKHKLPCLVTNSVNDQGKIRVTSNTGIETSRH